MPLEPGNEIGGRYVLKQRLGSGGMADVWLASDGELQRQVALKFLHERFAQDQQFVERFRREARAAAGLSHANVVGVYDRGESEGRHWIAMEYVKGASLKDLINHGLEPGEAVEIIRQVLAGVRFAHERGIVHRDLKPQNVLVDAEGRARVADFGIARAGASEITQTGSVLGTAQYLSPEQAQGLETTATSDLYSVGVMLYEALTGRVPFEAETAVAVALMQVSEQPQPPSRVNPKVSPALDAVVLRALTKDPAARFQSAAEFSRALDAAEADPSGEALGATAAFAPVAVGAETEDVDGDEAEGADERKGWFTRRRAIVLALLLAAAVAVGAWALTRPSEVNVPNVVERGSDDARGLLVGRGLEVALTRVPSCSRLDSVTEQDPISGTQVDEGSEVRLTVSDGLERRVPALAGVALEQARGRLEKAQLNLADTREQASRDVDSGSVIDSSPAGGARVQCQSNVTLTVSKGPNLVELPDVLGQGDDVATAALERRGFIVDVDTRDADEAEGTVIGQDPGGGSQLRRGAEVTLIVSSGVGSITVPSVVGQSQDSASRLLQSRGLAVEVIVQSTDEESDDGRVLEQAPSPGTRARQGDSVTIVVGELIEAPEPETTTTTSTTSTTTTTTEQTPP